MMKERRYERRRIACDVRADQAEALKRLSRTTRVPMQEYLREAVDDLLAKRASELSTERSRVRAGVR